MKLINFQLLSQYKNLEELNLEFSPKSPITVLIGNNGSGKTNILEAISHVFSQLYKKEGQFDFLFKLSYCINGTYYRISYITHQAEGSDPHLIVERRSLNQYSEIDLADLELPKRVICNYSGEDTRLWERIYSEHYNTYISSIRGRKGTTLNNLQMIYVSKDFWEIILLVMLIKQNVNDAFRKFISDTLSISGEVSVNFQLKPEVKNWTEENKFTFYLKRLRETFQEELVFNSNNPLDFDPEDETEFDLFQNLVALRDITASLTVKMKKGIESNSFSEGEKKLMVVLFILEALADESSLILMDEPDSHIHVTRKKELVKLLRETENRFSLITTHSPTLTADFALVDRNSIIMLKKDNNGKIRVISKEDRDLVADLTDGFWSLAEQNIFLSSNKDIMIVEGISDAQFIQSALENFQSRGKYLELSFEYIPCGGASNVKSFCEKFVLQAPEQRMFAFFDSDEAGLKGMQEILPDFKGSVKDFGKAVKKNNTWFSFYIPYKGRRDKKNFNIEDYFTLKFIKKNFVSQCTSLATIKGKESIKKELFYKCKNGTLKPESFNKFSTLFEHIIQIKKADERGETKIISSKK